MNNLPALHKTFNVIFSRRHIARAIRISQGDDIEKAVRTLGIKTPVPVIFVSGGASNMSVEDRLTINDMLKTVAKFAHDNRAIIIDGGTESGVMKMVGDLRTTYRYRFPLIGVSPLGKVSFPGYQNPNEEAVLEDHHTHFILVDGQEWGDETQTIITLTHVLSGYGRTPSVGILINGGKIALHEIFLASTQEHKLSIIVLEGSGRAADEISTAYRQGKSNRAILRAILSGGDIKLVATSEGSEALHKKLLTKFS